MSNLSAARNIAEKYGFTFKKSLGQNFMTDSSIVSEIAESAGGEGIIEIGPGFGVLTEQLAQRYKKVVAVEIDERLIPILEDNLAGYNNVSVICADCMKTDMKRLIDENFGDMKVSVAANLPYYITTPVIAMLLEQKLPFENIVIMVQKEVAQRICSCPGKKEYGAISVLCQYYTQPEIIAKVPAGLFVPPPKVDSAVLKLRVRKKPPVSVIDEKMFFKVVRASFAQRRKTLLNSLANGGFGTEKSKIDEILNNIGIKSGLRGEVLSVKDFALIADEFCKINN